MIEDDLRKQIAINKLMLQSLESMDSPETVRDLLLTVSLDTQIIAQELDIAIQKRKELEAHM